MTDETKKKRGRPKGKKDSPDIVRPPLPKKERTEAQIAAQFKPGNKANADGWSMRSEIRSFRKKCHNILASEEVQKAMITLYINLAESGSYKEWMELNRFLAEYAYGKPKEMLETEESVNVLSPGTDTTQPVIGLLPNAIEDAEESDQAYL